MANQSISRNQVLAISLLALAANLHAQSAGSVTNRVLAYFDHLSKEQHLDEYLTLARPTPVSMRYKAAALANLPPNSNVQLSAGGQAKLAALAPILEFYDRTGIIEPQVIGDNETTFIGLYERCALIITQKALDLLSQQEIQAVVAHELAHQWYWDEWALPWRPRRLPMIAVSDTRGTHQSKRQGSPPGQIGTLKFKSLQRRGRHAPIQ